MASVMAPVVESAERRLSEWIIAHRWWFLVLAPLAVLALATGVMNLEFKGDYRVFFSEDNPQLQAFDKLEKTYTQDDNVIFLLIPEDGEVFRQETLSAVEDLTERAWQIPHGLRVDSVTNFQHTEAQDTDDGDMLVVRDLMRGAAKATDAEIARARAIALAEPLLVGKLVTETGALTLVNVTIQLPRVDEQVEIPAVVDAAQRIARQMRADYPHLDIRLSGMVIMNHAFSSAAMNDMRSLTLVSFAIMLVVLLLLLRSGWGALGTFLVILLSVLAGLGIGGHLDIPFTPPSAASPLIILTMAIADSVHILVIFYRELPLDTARNAGRWAGREERRRAMAESLRLNLQPVFFTSLTTAIGFLTLNFSEVPPFRDMGNFVAAGVAVAFILSVTFLPALMVLLPARARRPSPESEMMNRFADFVLRNQRRLLWSMTGVILVLMALIPQNQLNDIFVHYLDERVEFRRDTDLLNEHLGGLYRIDYALDSGRSNGINDPAFLGKVDQFARWLRGQPEVTHVETFTDTLKRLNRNLHGDDPAWHRLPGTREMAAQYLLLYEMSLPYGLDLNNRIDVDRAATRVSATIRVLSTKEIMALDGRARDWFRDNAPELETEGTSPTMMFAHIGSRNAKAMIGATTVALVLISLILILALRSVKMGLASMIPNLIPAAMGFGVWGLLVGEVGLGLSVVTGMTLGIVVDDTVHFLSKYLRARRERGDSPEEAVRYAFSRVGWALIVTTLVLMVGFLIMTLSSFYPNSGMGLLTAIVLGMALITDFLLLPPLLMKIESRADK